MTFDKTQDGGVVEVCTVWEIFLVKWCFTAPEHNTAALQIIEFLK